MAGLLWSCAGELLALSCNTGVKVLDGRDGSCKFSYSISNDPQKIQPGQELDTSTLGHGVLCCFSNSGKLFALCTPQKELLIWQTSDWKLLNKREVVRRTTVFFFTHKEDYIVVGNKGGEVYRFFVKDASQEKELLLGHVSMILDMVLTKDDNFLITSDRDEKIRISCFPNSYNIHSFCLGSLDFVSCLALLALEFEDVLISGGGDGYLRIWNLGSGQQITFVKVDDTARDNSEKQDKEDKIHCPAISCIACSPKYSVVCALLERCRILRLYHVTNEKKVTGLPSLASNVPPWSAMFDPCGRLWCVQNHPEEPVIVFEPKGAGLDLTFSKLSSDFSPVLSLASDWSFFQGCINQERKLETLRKKEVDNISEYLARKEDRIEKKRGKNQQSISGYSKDDTESEAKRPRLET
ncbi:tRNA (guanine-N(7)-)-methyltransferase non-catalytic subunit WDR4-like [Montipora capricornis]|uniref:tRNA (guanine-N(7)-)-methyltransferase non-catalytic subunit WDR4-like n=1 Tax=Montipora capricornis TaxID=246305 RepID=UPI0035F1917B